MSDAIVIKLSRENNELTINAKGDGISLIANLVEGTTELLPRIGMSLESYISCLTKYAEPRLRDIQLKDTEATDNKVVSDFLKKSES